MLVVVGGDGEAEVEGGGADDGQMASAAFVRQMLREEFA